MLHRMCSKPNALRLPVAKSLDMRHYSCAWLVADIFQSRHFSYASHFSCGYACFICAIIGFGSGVNIHIDMHLHHLRTIHKFSPDALRAGYLADVFRRGSKVAVLVDDPRVKMVSKWCFSQHIGVSSSKNVEVMPWNASIPHIAKNYWTPDCGDVWHYVDGKIGYISRKIQLSTDVEARNITVKPPYFIDQNKKFTIPNDLISTIWILMKDVFDSVLPSNGQPFDHIVSFERLKYDDSFEAYRRNLSVIQGSFAFSRWTRLGNEIDVRKELFRGVLSKKYLRDALSVLCVNRRLRSLVLRANDIVGRGHYDKELIDDDYIIGHPHFDNDRYFACLLSWRNSYRTDYLDRSGWHELPIDRHSLTILPGRLLELESDIKATKHRIVMRKSSKLTQPATPNVTVLLGVMPRSGLPAG